MSVKIRITFEPGVLEKVKAMTTPKAQAELVEEVKARLLYRMFGLKPIRIAWIRPRYGLRRPKAGVN